MKTSEDLEKSLQFSTWKICSQIAETYNVKFTKEFVCTLGQLAFEQIGVLAEDLEWFAKHAKRSVINGEDVKLLVRRIPKLCEHIEQICLKNSKPKKKAEKRKKADPGGEESKDADGTSTSKSKKVVKKKDETWNP